MVNTSLSDYDVPRLAEKELKGLGNLKRAANFSNINNLDENETFSDKANLNHSQWESFDDTDGALPALSKNKFSDVADANDGRNTGNPDMWSFTPDSIINVSTGEFRLSFLHQSKNIIYYYLHATVKSIYMHNIN